MEGVEVRWTPEVLARGPLLRCLPIPGTSHYPGSLGLGWDPPTIPCFGCRDREVGIGASELYVCGAWTHAGARLWMLW